MGPGNVWLGIRNVEVIIYQSCGQSLILQKDSSVLG